MEAFSSSSSSAVRRQRAGAKRSMQSNTSGFKKQRGLSRLAAAAAAAAVAVLVACAAVAPAAAAAPPAPASSCPDHADPVCGADGVSYYNACLAALQGVAVAAKGNCAGAPFRFPEPSSSSSSGSSSSSKQKPPKERADAALGADVINKFAADGFSYVGRSALSHKPTVGGRRSAFPPGVAAVRFTPEGHVYVAKGSAQESAAGAGFNLPPRVPPGAKPTAAASPAKSTAAGRKLQLIVGGDDRKLCPLGPAFPFSAIGQIDFTDNATPFICTGTLITPTRVLTAAHCVWDVDTGAFVDLVTFAPGRYRGAGGRVVDPFGSFKWKHATLMKNYIETSEMQGDVAVITLDRAAPSQAGTLGLKAACADGAGVGVTTAGYPSDKPEGECYTVTCTVDFSCASEATRHTCDTFMGQSGSSFWDSSYYMRGVHVRGLVDENVNEFTTISPSVLAKIKQWEGRESGGVDPSRRRRLQEQPEAEHAEKEQQQPQQQPLVEEEQEQLGRRRQAVPRAFAVSRRR